MTANWIPTSYDDDYLRNTTEVTPIHFLKWLARNPVSCYKPMLLFSLRNEKCTFESMFEQIQLFVMLQILHSIV